MVKRHSDGAVIPNDMLNREWQDYVAWCDAGGVASVADVAPLSVPDEPNPALSPTALVATIADIADISDIAAERERRMALGFTFDFGDERGMHHIGTTAADMAGWSDVTTWAQAKIALGESSGVLQILTDTGPVTVTALEWQRIIVAATAFRQPLWAKSFVLMALDPIPANYASDSWWI